MELHIASKILKALFLLVFVMACNQGKQSLKAGNNLFNVSTEQNNGRIKVEILNTEGTTFEICYRNTSNDTLLLITTEVDYFFIPCNKESPILKTKYQKILADSIHVYSKRRYDMLQEIQNNESTNNGTSNFYMMYPQDSVKARFTSKNAYKMDSLIKYQLVLITTNKNLRPQTELNSPFILIQDTLYSNCF